MDKKRCAVCSCCGVCCLYEMRHCLIQTSCGLRFNLLGANRSRPCLFWYGILEGWFGRRRLWPLALAATQYGISSVSRIRKARISRNVQRKKKWLWRVFFCRSIAWPPSGACGAPYPIPDSGQGCISSSDQSRKSVECVCAPINPPH